MFLKQNTIRINLLVIISVLFSLSILAQNNNANEYPTEDPLKVYENTPKSPEVGSLGFYGNAGASPYNGKGNVSVPLYSVDFEGYTIPLILDYNTGGVRVQQEASIVGLNWNLSTSHGISRQIYGLDDFSYQIGGDYDQATTNGYIFNDIDLSLNEGAGRPYHSYNDIFNVHHSYAIQTISGRGSRVIDTQPDVFTLNALGQNYSFILHKKGPTDIVETYVFNNNNVKITLNLATMAFTLVDERGSTFVFDTKEINTTFNTVDTSINSSSYDSAFANIFEVTNRNNAGVIMNWYLDSVTSYEGKVMNLEYDRGLYFTFPQYTFAYNGGDGTSWGNFLAGQRISNGAKANWSVSTTVIENAYLREINGDFGKIIFNLDNRLDLSTGSTVNYLSKSNFGTNVLFTANSTIRSCHGTTTNCGTTTPYLPKKLNSISVENMLGDVVTTISFQQSYFNANKINDLDKERFLRLKLDGVTVNDKTHGFYYINPNNLAAKDSDGIDFWGFNNGKEATNTSKVPRIGRFVTERLLTPYQGGGVNALGQQFLKIDGADRSSDFTFGKNGLLNTLVYPTGGSTTFQYEPHEAVLTPTPQYEVTEYFPNEDRYRWTNMTDESQFNITYEYLKCAKDADYNYFEKEYPIIQGDATESNHNMNTVFDVLFPSVVQMDATLDTHTGWDGMSYWGNYDLVVVEEIGTGQQYRLFKHSDAPGTQTEEAKQLSKTVTIPPGQYKVIRTPLPYLGPNYPSTPGVSVNPYEITLFSYDQADPDLSSFLESFEIGGARIQRIINRDGDGSFISGKSYEYDYRDGFEGLSSSGLLMDDLIFHSKTSGFYSYDARFGDVMLTAYNSVGGNPNAQGSHIGYSFVREAQIDGANNSLGYIDRVFHNQKNEYFTSSYELPYLYDLKEGNGDPYITVFGIKTKWFCSGVDFGNDCAGDTQTYSSLFGDASIQNTLILGIPLKNSFGYANGNILQEKVYDVNGNLVQEQTNEYTYLEGQLPALFFSSFKAYPLYFSLDASTDEVLSNIWQTSEGPWGTNHSTYYPYEFPLHYSLKSKMGSSESKTYLESGALATTTSSSYNQQTHHLTTTSQIDSKGKETRTSFFYPYDTEVSSNTGMEDLITENRFSSPIKTDTYLDDDLLYSSLVNYEKNTNTYNKTKPWSVEIVRGIENATTNPALEEYTYEKYNAVGKVLQIRKSDGVPVTFIWGFNSKHMVARIVNATHNQIEALSAFGSNFDLGTGGLSSTQVDALRNELSDVMVTTYDFKPLVGVKSITNPRGYTIFYEYDTDNRLKSVKDAEGNLVTDYDYKLQE